MPWRSSESSNTLKAANLFGSTPCTWMLAGGGGLGGVVEGGEGAKKAGPC